jgi:hypothetical protein
MRIKPYLNGENEISFVVYNDTDEDFVMMRQFVKRGFCRPEMMLHMHSYGGNSYEKRESFNFGWVKRQDWEVTRWKKFKNRVNSLLRKLRKF